MANSMIPSVWRTSSPSSFTKQFELSVEDHLAVRYARREPLPFGRFAGFVTICSLFVGLIIAHGWWKSGDTWTAVCIAAVSLIAGLLLAKLLYGFIRAQVWGFWIGFLNAREAINIPLEMTIDVKGVHILVRQQTWFCPWESLDTVEEDAERYYFWTSGTQTHILPKRLFQDEIEAENFAAALRTWWRQEPVSPPRRVGTKHLDWGQKS